MYIGTPPDETGRSSHGLLRCHKHTQRFEQESVLKVELPQSQGVLAVFKSGAELTEYRYGLAKQGQNTI